LSPPTKYVKQEIYLKKKEKKKEKRSTSKAGKMTIRDFYQVKNE